MRTKLANKRHNITSKVEHGNESYLVTFGFDDEGVVREVFCADPRIGSDIHALLTDSCILISIYLQTGGEPEKLVKSLGENRPEKEDRGPPSSMLGAIANAVLELQSDINEVKAKGL